jgi:hypothetical protein
MWWLIPFSWLQKGDSTDRKDKEIRRNLAVNTNQTKTKTKM